MARALSKLGYCSRAQAVELIRAGRVSVRGTIARDPEMPVHLKSDRILVDGRRVEAGRRIYLMVNKPRGVVTTAADEKDRPTIYGCIPRELPWVAPVGRLDMASEGLLLLTNDSEWGARITDPESHLEKTYHVRVAGKADDALLKSLTEGVQSSDGDVLRAKDARIVRHGERNAWVEIVLDEGKNRHIRRMLEALGVEVLRLVRVAIGPLPLGELAKGTSRALTAEEKGAIDGALGPVTGKASGRIAPKEQHRRQRARAQRQ